MPESGSPEDRLRRRIQPFYGNCLGSVAIGGRYLVFLARNARGDWYPMGDAFFRASPDVALDDPIWFRTVRRYRLLLQQFEPMAQVDALRAMLVSGRGLEGERLTSVERTDIERHLSIISPWKPTALLLDTYQRAASGQAITLRPYDLSHYDERPLPTGALDLALVRVAVLESLAAGSHPNALHLFEQLSNATDLELQSLGPVLRWLAKNGRFDRAFALVEVRLVPALESIEREDARHLLLDVEAAVNGPGGAGANARWRGDPSAASRWSSLARSIDLAQLRRFGSRLVDFSATIDRPPQHSGD